MGAACQGGLAGDTGGSCLCVTVPRGPSPLQTLGAPGFCTKSTGDSGAARRLPGPCLPMGVRVQGWGQAHTRTHAGHSPAANLLRAPNTRLCQAPHSLSKATLLPSPPWSHLRPAWGHPEDAQCPPCLESLAPRFRDLPQCQLVLACGTEGALSLRALRDIWAGVASSPSCTSFAQNKGDEGHRLFHKVYFYAVLCALQGEVLWDAGYHSLPTVLYLHHV